MPKLACPCGFVHDLSPIPDDGWTTISDRDCCEFAGRGDELMDATERQGLLYECPSCGRLFWRKPDCETYRVYSPEGE